MAFKAKTKPVTGIKPLSETKAQKFVRLAEARVSKAVKYVRLVGNLSGSGYDYTSEQVKKVEDALASAVEATIARFVPKTAEGKAAESSFKL